MPRRKKTLRDESDALLDRHRSLPATRRKQLRVYVESLNERIISLRYAFAQAQRYSEGPPTTETYAPFSDRPQKRDFYTNAFWAFSYSCLDILAHVVNMIHPLVNDESKIGFNWAAKNYKDLPKKYQGQATSIPAQTVDVMAKIAKSRYFARLSRYRQCCLHRRAVCIMEETTTRKLSTAYTESTAPHESPIVALICDDPDNIKPKFDKKRSIDGECQNLLDFVEEKAKAILRSL